MSIAKVNLQGINELDFDSATATLISPGVVEVNISGGGSGITSINGDTTSAQLLIDGHGILIVDDGVGDHTFSLTGLRSVGTTFDGGSSTPSTPIVRNIQVGFSGTIVGWSVVNCNTVGSLLCDVDKHASSAPPAAPAVPNTTTDKISASAPITLSSAQSSSGGASAISTWSPLTVAQWDVIQFNITSITSLTTGAIILWIQE